MPLLNENSLMKELEIEFVFDIKSITRNLIVASLYFQAEREALFVTKYNAHCVRMNTSASRSFGFFCYLSA